MKNVCIVGTGPAGLYTAKYLLPHFKVTAYERDSQPCGLFKYFYKSNKTHFDNVLKHQNFMLKTNVNVEKINDDYDAFVIATGAESKSLDIKGKELLLPSLNVIKHYKTKDDKSALNKDICFKDKDVLIVGCGNVAMDLARYLIDELKNLFIICRRGPFQMSCTNNELRDLYELNGVGIKHNVNIEEEYTRIKSNSNKDVPEIKDRILRSRKKMMEVKPSSEKNINFFFNTNIDKIHKSGDKMNVSLIIDGAKKQLKVDNVISSIGFINKPKDYFSIKKPLFFVGWVKNPRGNLLDIKQDSYNTAQKIIKYFKS